MTEQEAIELIEVYNAACEEQRVRLQNLMEWFYARKFYKVIRFGGGSSTDWINLTHTEPTAQGRRWSTYVDNLIHRITEYKFGDAA